MVNEVKRRSAEVGRRNKHVTAAIVRGGLIDALIGGTPEMQKGEFVPQYTAEDDANYKHRLSQTELLGGYDRTVGYLTGQVFQKDIELEQDAKLSDLFERMKNDVDLQGNDLRTFSQEFFEQAVHQGARFILVQYPVVHMNELGQYWDTEEEAWLNRTKEMDTKQGWRPYFIHFGYDQLLGWRFEYVNGVRILVQLRILETVIEPGEFDVEDNEVEQVRLLERGSWSTWRKVAEDDSRKGEEDIWELYEEGASSLQEIPLAIYMPGVKQTEMTAIPALENLAYIERGHFIATSDHNMLMAYCRRPIFFGKCVSDDGAGLVASPGCVLHSNDPNASFESVGTDGNSIKNSLEDLVKKEERMSLYGLLLLTPGVRSAGKKTATQAENEASETTSQLRDWAQSLKDCFDNALKFAAQYENLPYADEPELKINLDFRPGMGLEPSVLLKAEEQGILPRQMVFDELQRRALITDTVDWAEVQAMFQRQNAGIGASASADEEDVRSIADRILRKAAGEDVGEDVGEAAEPGTGE